MDKISREGAACRLHAKRRKEGWGTALEIFSRSAADLPGFYSNVHRVEREGGTMSAEDRLRWDEKYRGRLLDERLQPNVWLAAQLGSGPRGRAVDVATGLGHNAVWLAQQGWAVEGWDVSPRGLALAASLALREGVQVDWRERDLDSLDWPVAAFDLIVGTRFYLPAAARSGAVAALRPGGLLIWETFTLDQAARPGAHFRDDRYLLRPGELLRWFPELRVRHYRDEVVDGNAVASLVAEKGFS